MTRIDTSLLNAPRSAAPQDNLTFSLFPGRQILPPHTGGALYDRYDWTKRRGIKSNPGFSRAVAALTAGHMIHVYVTGFPPALCEFLAVAFAICCPGNCVGAPDTAGVTLWHYDRENHSFWPQVVIPGKPQPAELTLRDRETLISLD